MKCAAAVVGISLLVVGAGIAQEGEWENGAFVLGKKTETPEKSGSTLRFDWPVPSKFRVLHRQKERGHETFVEHRMQLLRDTKSGDLILRSISIRLLELNGRNYRGLNVPDELASAFALPALRIDARGKVIEPFEFDAFLAKKLRSVGKRLKQRGGERKLAAWEAKMRSPGAIAQMAHAAGSYWRDWVEAFAGVAVTAGTETKVPRIDRSVKGLPNAKAATVNHRGPTRSEPEHVRLTYRSVLTGGDARKAIGDPAAAPETARARTEHWKLVHRVDAVVHEKTLQPAVVNVRHVATLSAPGGRQVTNAVTHQYTFDWSTGTN